ncbi:MAG: ATP-binding cassette domain-containing protein [Ruminococcaceae bacterium]|jgi:molybdate transport system ATP-binding protein|nr:ATP-binding cassette domain-containing protein [Oscillospiraceae bacterium]
MLLVDIKKKLGSFQLDVQFETDGGALALLGASGCGKSMTLKCIAGVEKPDSGRIVLNGRTLFDSEKRIDLPPQRRRVGYLFQQYALFPHMTAVRNIAAGARHLSPAERRRRVAEVVRALRLEGLEDRCPTQLSGGQQQRVALGRILVGEPEALLLDEPFAALDSYLRWQVELELMDTLRDFDGDVVFVSHDRGEVIRLCDAVCVLTDGCSAPQESVRQLMQSPGTVSAALLSGCKNYSLAERLDEHTARCVDWGVILHTEAPVPPDVTAVGIRAHHIAPGPGAENAVSCTVARVIEDTFSTVVMLATPGGGAGRSLLRMELDKAVWEALSEPEALTVHLAPAQVMPLTGGGL